jgi:nucleoside-diphosphate-sugar epimerase
MSERTAPLPLRRSLAGKHVFLTGGSGFLGKVWLAMALTHLPEIGRIYVFLRPKALVPARQRFEKMLNSSPAFRPLHERYGARFSEFVSERVEVVEGELSSPNLGLPDDVVRRLRRELDVFIHCAGLVDFNPDLRKAISSNVDATMRVADFVEGCDRAALLHISTCYVAGRRYGNIDEVLPRDYAPVGAGFDAEAEVEDAKAAIDQVTRSRATDEEQRAARAEVIDELNKQGRAEPTPKVFESLLRKRLRERLKDALVDEGMERAQRWGWPNTYTYTKSLAESLLARRQDRIRLSVLRPSIVESALDFPFEGWNESFNGSAPLAYIMGSWFRMVPAKPLAPFDVIPVDEVCRAMTIASAALVTGRHAPVYHVGSSDRNACSVGRAADLIVLSHRRHFRERHRTRMERVVKSRWDAVLVEPDNPFGVKASRSVMRGVLEAIDMLPEKLREKADGLVTRLNETDDRFAQIEKLVKLYQPFMYESHYEFRSRALSQHPALEEELAFRPERVDWRKYWLDVHMPGLRRWAFPLIEGKRPERYRSEYPVRLSIPPAEPTITTDDHEHGCGTDVSVLSASAGEG